MRIKPQVNTDLFIAASRTLITPRNHVTLQKSWLSLVLAAKGISGSSALPGEESYHV